MSDLLNEVKLRREATDGTEFTDTRKVSQRVNELMGQTPGACADSEFRPPRPRPPIQGNFMASLREAPEIGQRKPHRPSLPLPRRGKLKRSGLIRVNPAKSDQNFFMKGGKCSHG